MEDKKRNPATKAKQKFNDKSYDRLYPYVKKGKKSLYQECADKLGYSLNEFIEKTLDEKVKETLK